MSGSPPVMRICECQAEEDRGETVELRPGENFVVIAVVFRVGGAAVYTAEIAAVRDGDAQVRDLAAEFVVKSHGRAASWMLLPLPWRNEALKQNRRSSAGNRALTEKVSIFGVIAPFQAREARAFPPKPSAPIVSRGLAQQPWVISPVGFRGRSFEL